MKRITFVFLLSQLLLSINLMAQNWVTSGNALSANGTLGSTTNFSVLFKSNNSERGRLTNSGLWGFGTTAPNSKVHINSASGQNPLRAQINGSTKFLVHSGGGVSIGSSSAPPINGLYVSGNVGIGTTTPGYKLHIRGAEEEISLQGLFATASNQVYMTFRNSASTRVGYVGDGSNGDNDIFLDSDLGDVALPMV